MKPENIDSLITNMREEFKLSWGLDKARYDNKAVENLLIAYKNSKEIGFDYGIGGAFMFLGRLLEIKGDYLGARLFYLRSKTIFDKIRSSSWIPAKEYLSACPHGDMEASKQFKAKEGLVEENKISADDLIREHFQEHAHFAA
jgi:hypothetical protein